jgi:hypothetical protein
LRPEPRQPLGLAGVDRQLPEDHAATLATST